MSDVIDTTVVKLGFDNKEFINNVNLSIMAVDALKDSLTFDSKSFDSLSKAANNIDLSTISSGVEALSERFSTFGIVGMTAIQRITNAVIDLGGKFAGLLAKPWKQILTGGWSRASNIGQAKFQLEGLFGKTEEGIAKLNMTMMATGEQVAQLAQQAQGYSEDMIVAMNAADYAVADTAYGLDSAAKAASVLATSGVDVLHFSEDLKDANGQMRTEMQVALRSISGVAAMANTSYDEIAHVFERISGNSRVMAIDLQSLSARGLNAAATLRDYLNEIGVTANATEKDIRDMVSNGEIDFMTFAKAMDSAYGDHAKDANNTFSGAFSNMKFALSKIGADFITPIRNKMVPLFNDIRISINQVRKALNFKMKFPGLEEEISLVELFTRIITNLTAKAHDLFTMWHGGQNVMEQAMAGFATRTGQSIEQVRSIFDEVTNGNKTSAQGVKELIDSARFRGADLTEVYQALGETFEKTEDQIKQMCENGEISFEDFYAAMSSVFGGDIQDTRISQLAQLINNITQGFWNLARTISSIVGPVIYAFFQVFNLGGIKGIVGITEAFANFTKTLVASREIQEKIRSLAFNIFTILKSGISIVKKLARAAFQIIQAIAPLFIQIIEFADVIASVVSYIVDIIVESNLLSSVISVLTRAFQVGAFVIVNALRIILAIVGPAIKAVGEVFAFLARSIASVDVSFIGVIIDAFENLVGTILNGGLMNTLINAVGTFFGAIGKAFKGLTLSFAIVSQTVNNVANRIATILDRIVTSVRNSTGTIGEIFNKFTDYIKSLFENPRKLIALIGQMTSLTILVRFAQTMRGIGRTFSGLGNYLNSNAILAFVNAIKVLARAVLEFSIGIVLLSSIPTDQLTSTIKLIRALTLSVASFLAIYFFYMYQIAKLNNSVVADPMIKFMNKLNASINAFLQSIGRATNITAFAVLLISAAASLAFFFKAVKDFATLDTTTFETGLKRVAFVVGLIAAFLAVLFRASGLKLKGDVVKDNVIFGSTGLMGAALVMLSLLIVLKAFEDIIKEYASLKLIGGDEQWKNTLIKIGESLILIIGSVSLLGLTSKKAGFGLIGSVTAMMGVLTALQGFCDVIKSYAALAKDLSKNYSGGQIAAAISMLLGATTILIFGIVAITEALTEGSSAFKASLKGGIEFKSNSAKFFGIVLIILSMCLFMQMFALAANAMDPASIGNAVTMIIMLGVVLAAIAGVVALSKKVPTGNIIGLSAILLILSSVLPLLSAFEWTELLSSAGSLTLVILSLSLMLLALTKIPTMSWQTGLGNIVFMGSILVGLTFIFGMLSALKPDQLMSSAAALSSIIISFSAMFAVLGAKKFAFNAGALKQMAGILSILTPFIAIFSWISMINFDPKKLLSLISAVSLLGIAIAASTKILSKTEIVNAGGLFTALIGMSIAMGIMAAALTAAANRMTADGKDLIMLALAIDCLAPILIALAGISVLMNKLGASWIGVGMMGAIVGIVTSLVFVFALIAQMGDVRATIGLMKGLGESVVGLIAFIGILSALSVALGFLMMTGFGALGFAAGLLAVGSVLTTIGIFLAAVAAIAQIGNSASTITLLSALGTSFDSMIPFLIKMAAMCTIVGLVSPLVISGAAGFGAILTIMSGFAYVMAIVSSIGNPTNMTGMISSLTEAFNELAKTFAVLGLLGLMAPLILTSLTLITSAMLVLLALSIIIGKIDVIRNAILSGISTILITATSLVAATEAMSLVDLVSILKFITALGIIALAPMVGITKFALIASAMAVIGISSSNVIKGTKTAFEMIKTLSLTAGMINAIARMNTRDLPQITKDILQSAANLAAVSKYVGEYVSISLANGVVSETGLYAVAYAGTLIAHVLEEAIRNELQVHSESPKYVNIGEWLPISMGDGVISGSESLMDAGQSVMSTFGGNMTDLAGNYGTAAGGNFIASMEDTVLSGLKYLKENNVFNDYYQYFHNGVITEHTARVTGMGATPTGDTTTTNTVVTDVKFRGNFQSYEEYLAWEKEHPNGDTENTIEFDYEMPDFGNLDDWLKGLNESFNLGSITEGLGDINSAVGGLDSNASSASKSVDELTKKIDDLMEKYENLWEDAKERANKDLFKGVDEQGDDFLDSVEEIMDKFKNIYKEAVEKTNGEDLFAEVNESDESFAPDTLLRNLEDQVNQVNELNTIIGSLSGRIADNGLRAAISQMSVDDLPELRAMYRMDNTQLAKYEQMYQKKVQANQNKIQNELTGSLSQLTGQYTNVATYVATDASTSRLIHNLQAQVDQLNEYNSTVASLMVRIKDVNLREAIATMGVDSIEELKNLNRMTDAQLDEYVALYNTKISANAQSIKNELSAELSSLLGQPLDIEQFYIQYKAGMASLNDYVGSDDSARKVGNTMGSQMASGASESIASMKLDKDEAYAKGKEYMEAMANGTKDPDAIDLLISNLDSIANLIVEDLCDHYTEEFVGIGTIIMQCIIEGLEEARDAGFDESIDGISQTIIDRINSFEDRFVLVGKNIVYGIRKGMLSGDVLKQLEAAAMNVAARALQAAKAKLKIHSPSRAFMEIGKFLDEGFAIGIKDYSGLVSDEAEEMSGGTFSAVQDAIQQLSGMLDGSIDLNPTITPTLDLSEINARSAALAGMFSNRQIAVQARADEQQAEMMTQLGNIIAEQNSEPRTMTFNQNNYSPKALSRTEIYRQTRNGFSQLASAIQ